MNIKEIYHKYRIPPNLQLHHYRVAAVGKLIAINSTLNVEIDIIVLACLIHDLGNIIKFDFSVDSKRFAPEGIEYWKKVKEEFVQKYGEDEHRATQQIAKEIGTPKKAIDLIDRLGFSNMDKIFNSGDLELYICEYSDMRVSPYGVLSISDRFAEGMRRWNNRNPDKNTDENNTKRLTMFEFLKRIETEIFQNSKIKPEDVNDESIKGLVQYLQMQENFSI